MATITSQDLTGSIVALVTPMNEDGSINFTQWKDLINWHIRAGSDGIVVAGTTGESAMLQESEYEELIRTAVQITQKSDIKVIAGTGAISPATVSHKNAIAHHLGADAVLVVTPYYIRVTQPALIEHYQIIANDSPLPIILYNVPTRTGMDITTEATTILAKHDNIIGIKEAKIDMDRISRLSKIKDFAVLSGDDDSFLTAIQQGADGVISVAANIRPHTLKSICSAIQLGDDIQAQNINNSLQPIYKLLSAEPNPGPVKSALMACNIIGTGIRKPLTRMNISGQSYNPILNSIKEEYQYES